MARNYTVCFDNITVSTVSDLAAVVAASSKYAELVRVWVGDVDSPIATAVMIRLALQFLPSVVTGGTGNTPFTPLKQDQGDPSAASSAFVGPTSALATSSGTIQKSWPMSCHVFQGLDVQFPEPIPIINGEGLVFQVFAAPVAALKLSGGLLFRERGG